MQNFNNKKIIISSALIVCLLLLYAFAITNSQYLIVFKYFILIILIVVITSFISYYFVKTQTLTFEQKINSSSIDPDKISSNIKPTTTNITFNDIAGIDEIKDELIEIVDFLNKPSRYLKYDVILPKGILLVGPPGVGKTMIAKAVANEASVPFYYQSGASFVHIYVGMGAKKVRELFNVAKMHSPSIIFIDEIDAIGKTRGKSSNDERDSTLNELLTQMDGFDDINTVIVIAATNNEQVLDEALLRAGRFDRRVLLQLPTNHDRLKILEKKLKKIKYKFDINSLVKTTSGFNSAALVTLINEALLSMIRRNGTTIQDKDIEIAKNKIKFGAKQSTILTKQDKNILATHQATKAFVMQKRLSLFDEGVVFEDVAYVSKAKLEERISYLICGIVGNKLINQSEYIVFDSEITQAYKIANDMRDKYKLSTLNSNDIISNIKESLEEVIVKNQEKIIQLRDKLIKDEIVF